MIVTTAPTRGRCLTSRRNSQKRSAAARRTGDVGALLIAFRIMQGLSGGPIMPLTQAMLTRVFPPKKIPMAMGLWATTTITAPIFGPILGGWISDNWSWPWIFFINVPVVLMALVTLAGVVFTQSPAVAWSVFYGGLCITLPTALMAYGLTSSALSRAIAKMFPGVAKVSLAGVLLWEGVKVLLAMAMMWSAPRLIPDLRWLGLVAGLVGIGLGLLEARRQPATRQLEA